MGEEPAPKPPSHTVTAPLQVETALASLQQDSPPRPQPSPSTHKPSRGVGSIGRNFSHQVPEYWSHEI